MRKRYWQDAKSKLARKEDQGANLNQGPSAKANVLVISEPNIPTYSGFQGRLKAQQFHHSMKHSLSHLISEDRSFFLGWGYMNSNRYLMSGSDRPTKGLKWTHTHTHTHYQQHVMGFSARKSNSLSHLLSLFFKDQSYAHSWSLCESCLIN